MGSSFFFISYFHYCFILSSLFLPFFFFLGEPYDADAIELRATLAVTPEAALAALRKHLVPLMRVDGAVRRRRSRHSRCVPFLSSRTTAAAAAAFLVWSR